MKTVLTWRDDCRICTIIVLVRYHIAKQELSYKFVGVVVEDQKVMGFIYLIKMKKQFIEKTSFQVAVYHVRACNSAIFS